MKVFYAKFSTLFLIIGLLNPAQDAFGQNARRFEGDIAVTPLRGGVYMMVMEPAGNLGVSIGDDGAILIDSQFAPMTDKILAAIGELTDKPLRYVLNTHWHGDHTGSNANLGKKGYVIVAHDNVRVRMSAEQFHLFFRGGTPPSQIEARPVITFSESMTFHFNDDVIHVLHTPNAHTDGDSIYYFEKADILHTGDIFINRGFPVIDIGSDGSIKGQIEATNRALELVGPDTIIIPGHGPLADRDRMIEVRDMLIDVRSRVVSLIAQDMALEDIIAAKPLANLDSQWHEGFLKQDPFVTIIYQSETGIHE